MTVKSLIAFLLQWMSINTNFDVSKFDFPVNIVEKSQIERLVCGGKCPVVAFFSEKDGIFLAEIDLDSLCGQSILLHEMVHAFQLGLEMEAIFKEKEAYEIQNFFLSDISKKRDFLDILSVKKCRSQQTNEIK